MKSTLLLLLLCGCVPVDDGPEALPIPEGRQKNVRTIWMTNLVVRPLELEDTKPKHEHTWDKWTDPEDAKQLGWMQWRHCADCNLVQYRLISQPTEVQ